jgi:hypothetical protein
MIASLHNAPFYIGPYASYSGPRSRQWVAAFHDACEQLKVRPITDPKVADGDWKVLHEDTTAVFLPDSGKDVEQGLARNGYDKGSVGLKDWEYLRARDPDATVVIVDTNLWGPAGRMSEARRDRSAGEIALARVRLQLPLLDAVYSAHSIAFTLYPPGRYTLAVGPMLFPYEDSYGANQRFHAGRPDDQFRAPADPDHVATPEMAFHMKHVATAFLASKAGMWLQVLEQLSHRPSSTRETKSNWGELHQMTFEAAQTFMATRQRPRPDDFITARHNSESAIPRFIEAIDNAENELAEAGGGIEYLGEKSAALQIDGFLRAIELTFDLELGVLKTPALSRGTEQVVTR